LPNAVATIIELNRAVIPTDAMRMGVPPIF
jgi:hypothetical protein